MIIIYKDTGRIPPQYTWKKPIPYSPIFDDEEQSNKPSDDYYVQSKLYITIQNVQRRREFRLAIWNYLHKEYEPFVVESVRYGAIYSRNYSEEFSRLLTSQIKKIFKRKYNATIKSIEYD